MSKSLPIQIKNPGNTPELIAAAMRSAILQGRLKSNQPLRQDQIAEQFGVMPGGLSEQAWWRTDFAFYRAGG